MKEKHKNRKEPLIKLSRREDIDRKHSWTYRALAIVAALIVDAIINVSYGCNIVKVAQEVQDKVTNVVQSTTGFEMPQVNVHVSGISFDK